ncbi:MAG TPA: hypothetical protein VJU82_18295 [Acidobacteriaceae bacterium]|nr:hypothetical protein [Acidobacteriaceae bacterium]
MVISRVLTHPTPTIRSCSALDRLLNSTEYLGDILLQECELDIRDPPAWVQDHIHGGLEYRDLSTHCLAHAPLDAVTHDGIAHGAADGEAHTRATNRPSRHAVLFYGLRLAQQEEVAHLLAEPLAAGPVNPLILSVPAKPVGGDDHGTVTSSG